MTDTADYPYERRVAPTPPINGMERHLQTVIAFILTALLLWVGSTVNDNSIAIAKISQRMDHFAEELNEIKVTIKEVGSDRYTGNDADTDRAIFNERLNRLENRIKDIEDGTSNNN